MDSSDQSTINVVDQTQADADALSKAWGDSKVKIQNWDTYETLRKEGVTKEMLDKVSGDAERTRIPWRVFTGEEAPADDVKGLVLTVLGERSPEDEDKEEEKLPDGTKGLTATTTSSATLSGLIVIERLDTRLAKLLKSGDAVKLARKLGKMTKLDFAALTRIPMQSFDVFLKMSGFGGGSDASADSVDDSLRRAVEILLEGWRDPVVAEEEAMRLSF